MKSFSTQRFGSKIKRSAQTGRSSQIERPSILKPSFRIMITAVQMKMKTLVFQGQKIVHVVLVEKDRGKDDREKREEVGETEDEIGRKQEGIDEIKKKMIHLKNNCQRYILINDNHLGLCEQKILLLFQNLSISGLFSVEIRDTSITLEIFLQKSISQRPHISFIELFLGERRL